MSSKQFAGAVIHRVRTLKRVLRSPGVFDRLDAFGHDTLFRVLVLRTTLREKFDHSAERQLTLPANLD